MNKNKRVTLERIEQLPYWAQVAYACDCSERVLHFVEKRSLALSIEALQVARWCAAGLPLHTTAQIYSNEYDLIISSYRANVSISYSIGAAFYHDDPGECSLYSFKAAGYALNSYTLQFGHSHNTFEEVEIDYQHARLCQYEQQIVPSIPLPSREDLKFLLLHPYKDVRLEAVRALAFLGGAK